MPKDSQKFLIEVELRKRPSSYEGHELDPGDFVEFLQRFVVEDSAIYGLDAYNKDAPQLVSSIALKDSMSQGPDAGGVDSEDLEQLVWAALEPHLDTVIDLDLNHYDDNRSFGELVRKVAAVIRSGNDDSAEAQTNSRESDLK